MSIDKLSPWISVMTNIGVLIGIALLLFELSQNNQMLEIQSDDANFSHWTALNRTIATSPELADIVIRGNADLDALSPADLLRYGHYQTNYLNVLEHSYHAARRGHSVGTEEVYAAVLIDNLSYPGARAFYERYKMFFSEEFVSWADQLLSET